MWSQHIYDFVVLSARRTKFICCACRVISAARSELQLFDCDAKCSAGCSLVELVVPGNSEISLLWFVIVVWHVSSTGCRQFIVYSELKFMTCDSRRG